MRSRAEWYRRARAGLGVKIGSQWVVLVKDAEAEVEALRPQDS